MAHAHDHGQERSSKNKKSLSIVFAFTLTYLIAEVIGGIMTGSLALLADAGHMLTDVAGLGLAIFAIWFAEKPANASKTYGYYRVEILAAVANCIILLGISGYVLYEAYQRFLHPPQVQTTGMLIVAGIGLVVNIAGMFMLKAGSKESLNMKGAYFEVLSDMITSIGVIIAALIMMTTGWYYADPIISAGIGLFILPRTWNLLLEAVGILLEGTPSDINLAILREAVNAVPGVRSVHDLHVWSLTTGINAASMHVVLGESTYDEVLSRVQAVLKEHKIGHSTVQIEPVECNDTHI
ncbi:MAG TPA: cation transporter [Candidatus Melainabacteria bacterium]|nr:cation transporter [Candidatus Melainabacteria bacterium]HIN64998.1 cation transporter [Candidatus Obscuribacterales bacterium]